MALTADRGVDGAIQAVGIPESPSVCQEVVTAGGHIVNVGVHSKPAQLNLDKLWGQSNTLTTRLIDTVTTPMLLKDRASGKLQRTRLTTHHFRLDQVMEANNAFGGAMKERARRIVITRD